MLWTIKLSTQFCCHSVSWQTALILSIRQMDLRMTKIQKVTSPMHKHTGGKPNSITCTFKTQNNCKLSQTQIFNLNLSSSKPSFSSATRAHLHYITWQIINIWQFFSTKTNRDHILPLKSSTTTSMIKSRLSAEKKNKSFI